MESVTALDLHCKVRGYCGKHSFPASACKICTRAQDWVNTTDEAMLQKLIEISQYLGSLETLEFLKDEMRRTKRLSYTVEDCGKVVEMLESRHGRM